MADILFTGKMTSFTPNVPLKEGAITKFTIVVTEDTSVRTFPGQFKTPKLDVFDAMAANDLFDRISIPLKDYIVEYDVKFGDTLFAAKLENLTAVIKHTKDGSPFTVYTLRFAKEVEKDIDWQLSCYVKVKEENDEGKKVDKLFTCSMTEKEN